MDYIPTAWICGTRRVMTRIPARDITDTSTRFPPGTSEVMWLDRAGEWAVTWDAAALPWDAPDAPFMPFTYTVHERIGASMATNLDRQWTQLIRPVVQTENTATTVGVNPLQP